MGTERTDANPKDQAQLEMDEVKKVDPLDALRAELKGMQDRLGKAETQAKDLGAKLTRAQQENADMLRFHKATLPKINKTFEEKWEENPERAVVSEVEQRVAPMNDQNVKIQAELALTRIIVKNPAWAKYEEKVREISNEFPELTYKGEKGILQLFNMARMEDLEKKTNGKEEEMDKTKAITEAPSAKAAPSSEPAKLNTDQMFIARKFGIKPEDYVKQMKETDL